MNKLFTKIGTAIVGMAMAVGVGVAVGRTQAKEVKAAEEPFYSLIPVATGTNADPYSNYTKGVDATIGGMDWNVTGNSYQVPWRIGGKNTTDTDRAVYSKTKMGETIGKVTLSYGGVYAGKQTNVTINSITLKVYSDAAMENELDSVIQETSSELTVVNPGNSASIDGGSINFVPTSPLKSWAKDSYYKLIVNYVTAKNGGNSANNSYITLSQLDFYKYVPGDVKPLSIVAKQSNDTVIADKSTYVYPGSVGSSLSTIDFKVAAEYESGEGYKAGSEFVWTSSNTDVATITSRGNIVTATLLDKGTTTITVATADATEGNENVSTSFTLDASEAPYAKGTVQIPYTVAEAIADVGTSSPYTDISNAYVKGYVVKIVDDSAEEHGNITYNISDTNDAEATTIVQAYRGKSYDGNDFTLEDKVAVGDYVVVKGTLTYFTSASLYELKTSNSLVFDDHHILKFAEDFKAAMASKCTDENANNKSAVSEIWGTWKSKFEELHADAKALFVTTSENVTIQGAAKLYVHCVNRYGLDEWEGAPEVPNSSIYANNGLNGNVSTIGVIAVTVIGVLVTTITIAGLFYLRKKKEN